MHDYNLQRTTMRCVECGEPATHQAEAEMKQTERMASLPTITKHSNQIDKVEQEQN